MTPPGHCCARIYLCRDGANRCGIFCSVHICRDQLKIDGEVDVFNTVRLVRHNRPQLVTTIVRIRHNTGRLRSLCLAGWLAGWLALC